MILEGNTLTGLYEGILCETVLAGRVEIFAASWPYSRLSMVESNCSKELPPSSNSCRPKLFKRSVEPNIAILESPMTSFSSQATAISTVSRQHVPAAIAMEGSIPSAMRLLTNLATTWRATNDTWFLENELW